MQTNHDHAELQHAAAGAMSPMWSPRVPHKTHSLSQRPHTAFLVDEDSKSDLANRLGAMLLLILFAPLMAVLTFLVWRHDKSPALFAHYRVGQNGKLFRCMKFRTMRPDAELVLARLLASDPKAQIEWERDQKLTNDPRITPIGRILRRTSLDELPQLLNVLRGQMRLVGPRPITVGELVRYGRVRWHYLSVPPGMTGLWQVSGRSNTSYADRVALDKRYVEERSWWLNTKILLRTLRVVVVRDGAH